MGKYEIYILIDKVTNYFINKVKNALYIYVTPDVPFDKLSNRFNKYTHKITYTDPRYNGNDFSLYITDPNAWYYTYILSYYYPTKKVTSVDVFFPSNDSNKNPLVFGFNYDSDPSIYYTYYYLRDSRSPYYSLPSAGSFDKNDLLTRLLEELGLFLDRKKNQLVVIIDKKPRDDHTSVTYPSTGPNRSKLTVRKSDRPPNEHFDRYEHLFDPSLHERSFYLGYQNDSIYIEGGHAFKKINSVDVYIEKEHPEHPFAIVLNYTAAALLYKFSDFESDLKGGKDKHMNTLPYFYEKDKLFDKSKQIEIKQVKTQLETDEHSGLISTDLIEIPPEISDSLITFKLDQTTQYENVSVETSTDYGSNCIEYKHIPSKTGQYSKSLILINEKPFQINGKIFEDKLLEIYAYFTVRGSNEVDKIPFLIALMVSEDKQDDYWVKNKKMYFTRLHDKEINWFNLNKDMGYIDQRIRTIGRFNESNSKMDDLRQLAYDYMNDTTTFKLESKTNYSKIQVENESDYHTGFAVYKHSHVPGYQYAGNTSTIIVKNRQFYDGDRYYNKKLTDFYAYFLKNTENQEDTIPFLVVLLESNLEFDKSNSSHIATKTYYTTTYDNNNIWKNLNLGPAEMDEKLNFIDKIVRTATKMEDIRQKVYDYLNKTTTFKLDKKESYGNIRVIESLRSTKTYKIYDHQPTNFHDSDTSVVILNDELFTDEGKGFTYKLVDLSVYFMIDDENQIDDIPFLIVFNELETRTYSSDCSEKGPQSYFSKHNESETDWTELYLNGPQHFEDKMYIIDSIQRKEYTLQYLRHEAYKLLNRGLKVHPKYIKEEVKEESVLTPEQLGKIAGGVVGTAAIVGTSSGIAIHFPEWFIPVINALI